MQQSSRFRTRISSLNGIKIGNYKLVIQITNSTIENKIIELNSGLLQI